jgi:hypothetical protein
LFRKFGIILLALGAALAAPRPSFAQNGTTEYQIKAAFLYNFFKFVEWPTAGNSMTIGVLGKDPFGDDLADELHGKTINDKPLILKHPATLQEATTCDVLFISTSEKVRMAVILDALRGHAVLTVSDSPRFIQHGGMIGFSLEDNRVRFSINHEATDAAHLTVSSQLLKLAKAVIEKS